MRIRWTAVALTFLVVPTIGLAQDGTGAAWTWSAGISVSWLPGDSDWSVTHPYYGGGETTLETLRGGFSKGIRFEGDLEMRKGRIALRGTLGLMPQTFTQEAPAREEDFSLLTAGISCVLFPLSLHHGGWEPFVALGAGGQKASGGLDSTGFYFSGTGGIHAEIAERLALEGGVAFHRFKYTQVDLGNSIRKDLAITPGGVFLGTRILF